MPIFLDFKNRCRKCANNYNYSTEEWIELAKNKHDNKYDYSKVCYKNGLQN